jgi:glyoxylase-like metal-dependent hydrolase (beta-lactamase superfamily II)
MKKTFIVTLLILTVFFGFSQQNTQKTPITVDELAPGVHRLFVNNAVAVVAFTGNDGLLLIDAGYERTANDLADELKKISAQSVRYLINTHIHGDHTGGNNILGKDADIIAHQNVKDYLSQEQKQGERTIPAFPKQAQPNITFTDRMNLDFNDESLQLVHLEGGHTSGDIIVYIPNKKVLVVGDLLFANYFPYVDVGNGGNPIKFLENIDTIIKTFPKDAIVVGGHGPVYSIEEYKNYRNTLQKTIDVLKRHKQKGMTAEQMKEQKVLIEWESYGSWFITQDRWIDTIFPFI